MKRLFTVIVMLAMLFPLLLVPASAAEPEEYVFEAVEPIATYSRDFDFTEEFWSYSYLDYIPEGYYTLILTNTLGTVFESNAFYFSSFPEVNYVYITTVLYTPVLFETVDYLDSPNKLRSFHNISFNYSLYFDGVSCIVRLSLLRDGYTVPPSYFSLKLRSVSINDLSVDFLSSMSHGYADLSGDNLLSLILVAVGIMAVPVILWFSYRIVKRKVVKSFTKGKI